MPTGRCAASTTAMVPMRSLRIVSSAARIGVPRFAEHGVAPDHRAQRLEQGLLLDRPLAEVLAQLPERVLHDAGQRLRAELRERRRAPAAVRRSRRAAAGSRRRPRSPRSAACRPMPAASAATGKALAGAAHVVVARHGQVVHAHVAALDDVRLLRHPVGRIDDRRADREVRELGAFGDELEVLARHARERHVLAQEAQRSIRRSGRV